MNLKAISPVIATVIIVSVAIAIAVAVAFWMTGITGLFTRYEKLEVISAYATGNESSGWTIVVIVKNTGTSDATIDEIFINGKPLSAYDSASTQANPTGNEITITLGTNVLPSEGLSITTGSQWKISISVLSSAGFTSGQIIEVKLHTAAGNEYPKSVQLP